VEILIRFAQNVVHCIFQFTSSSQVPNFPGHVFIMLPESAKFEVIDTIGPLVGHLKDAIIAKFKKRFMGTDPDELQLYKLGDDGGSRTSLDPTQTLSEAGIRTCTKLVVVVAGQGTCV
jgi:hypothetical protein